MIGDDEVNRAAAANGMVEAREAVEDGGSASGAPKGAMSTEAMRLPKGGDLQAYIGRQLRAVYDDVARQPVPDRFLELMKKLESAGH